MSDIFNINRNAAARVKKRLGKSAVDEQIAKTIDALEARLEAAVLALLEAEKLCQTTPIWYGSQTAQSVHNAVKNGIKPKKEDIEKGISADVADTSVSTVNTESTINSSILWTGLLEDLPEATVKGYLSGQKNQEREAYLERLKTEGAKISEDIEQLATVAKLKLSVLQQDLWASYEETYLAYNAVYRLLNQGLYGALARYALSVHGKKKIPKHFSDLLKKPIGHHATAMHAIARTTKTGTEQAKAVGSLALLYDDDLAALTAIQDVARDLPDDKAEAFMHYANVFAGQMMPAPQKGTLNVTTISNAFFNAKDSMLWVYCNNGLHAKFIVDAPTARAFLTTLAAREDYVSFRSDVFRLNQLSDAHYDHENKKLRVFSLNRVERQFEIDEQEAYHALEKIMRSGRYLKIGRTLHNKDSVSHVTYVDGQITIFYLNQTISRYKMPESEARAAQDLFENTIRVGKHIFLPPQVLEFEYNDEKKQLEIALNSSAKHTEKMEREEALKEASKLPGFTLSRDITANNLHLVRDANYNPLIRKATLNFVNGSRSEFEMDEPKARAIFNQTAQQGGFYAHTDNSIHRIEALMDVGFASDTDLTTLYYRGAKVPLSLSPMEARKIKKDLLAFEGIAEINGTLHHLGSITDTVMRNDGGIRFFYTNEGTNDYSGEDNLALESYRQIRQHGQRQTLLKLKREHPEEFAAALEKLAEEKKSSEADTSPIAPFIMIGAMLEHGMKGVTNSVEGPKKSGLSGDFDACADTLPLLSSANLSLPDKLASAYKAESFASEVKNVGKIHTLCPIGIMP